MSALWHGRRHRHRSFTSDEVFASIRSICSYVQLAHQHSRLIPLPRFQNGSAPRRTCCVPQKDKPVVPTCFFYFDKLCTSGIHPVCAAHVPSTIPFAAGASAHSSHPYDAPLSTRPRFWSILTSCLGVQGLLFVIRGSRCTFLLILPDCN